MCQRNRPAGPHTPLHPTAGMPHGRLMVGDECSRNTPRLDTEGDQCNDEHFTSGFIDPVEHGCSSVATGDVEQGDVLVADAIRVQLPDVRVRPNIFS